MREMGGADGRASAVLGGHLSASEDKSKSVKNPKSHFPKSHTSAINQGKVGNPTEIPVNLEHCPFCDVCDVTPLTSGRCEVIDPGIMPWV